MWVGVPQPGKRSHAIGEAIRDVRIRYPVSRDYYPLIIQIFACRKAQRAKDGVLVLLGAKEVVGLPGKPGLAKVGLESGLASCHLRPDVASLRRSGSGIA